MAGILDKIVQHKRGEIAAAKSRVSAHELQKLIETAPPVRDFVRALATASPLGLIAEVKKASPSAGLIREDFDPVTIAKTYEAHGAACLSVLTDEHFFKGHLNYLRDIRAAVGLPVMRKEFILDSYQVLEARAAGADCCLLIAECLNDDELNTLYADITGLGMTALIEIYEPANLPRVLQLQPPLIGINNRNLQTFETTLDHTLDLRPQIPAGTLLVSESGIRTHADVQTLVDAGVQAILVGESLMRQPNIGAAVESLLGRA